MYFLSTFAKSCPCDLSNDLQYYSAELSQKVKRGQRESINKKNFLGGSVIYGYYIDNKKLVVNEEEASIVKEIFTSYASGKTADEIVSDLKKRNIKNRYGRYFCKNSIFNMLKNKRYLGVFKYGEYQISDYNPAIIDESLYNLCAEKTTRRKRSIEKYESYGDYILSGKLYCGECHEKMYGESGTSMTGKIYHYYKCSNRKKNLGCKKKNISRDYLEDLVMAITVDNLLKEDIVLDLVDKIVETYNNELGEDKELSILKKQLAENEKFITNILNAIKNGIFSESTQTELLQLEKEKNDILSSIAIRESKVQKPIKREQVLFFLKQFSTDKKAMSKSDMAKIVNLLIEMIILWNDKVVIVFKNGIEPNKPLNIDDIMASLVRESLIWCRQRDLNSHILRY